ncbi:MAG: hypothetical protein V3T84_10620 [Phycisphaerales bacterium]
MWNGWTALFVASAMYSSGEMLDVLAIQTGTGWQNSTINAIPDLNITVVSAPELMTIDFSDFDALYVSDVWNARSTPDWAGVLNDRTADILAYVNGGGFVLVGNQNYGGEGTTNGDEYNFLGGLADAPADLTICAEDVVITEPDHPLFDGLTSEDLSDWACSYHGILDIGTLPILATNNAGDPVIRGGPVGAGGVFVWTLDPDFHFDLDDGVLAALVLVENAVGLVEAGPACPWDLDDNGNVGASDLLSLLVSWGPCKGCPADFDGNGVVGATDLLALLVNWGPCP